MTNKQHNTGFTLIEISVVLVIIALVAGGITVGQSMIENSKMTGVAEERARLVGAANLFRDKYYTLPGDFNQAEAIWGTASGGCPFGARSGSQTCNGNGDGKVFGSETERPECYAFWQHLYNAGLVEHYYTGVHNTPAFDINPGVNVPNSQWTESAGWFVVSWGTISSYVWAYDSQYGTVFLLEDTLFNSAESGVMSPAQLKKLDTKFDDGEPDSGSIMATKSILGANCISGTSYNLSNTEPGCIVIWKTGF